MYVMVSVAYFHVNHRLNNCLFLLFFCWLAGLLALAEAATSDDV